MKDNRCAFSIAFSVISLVVCVVVLAVVVPREPVKLGVDYLGILVAILGAFATLLLAMQLYNVFSLKEDAKKVADAKDVIEKYAERVYELELKIKEVEEKAKHAIYIEELADDEVLDGKKE